MLKNLLSLKWKKNIYYVSKNVIFNIVPKPVGNDPDNCGTYLINMNELPDNLKKAANGTLIDICEYPKAFIKNVPYIKLFFNDRGQSKDISYFDNKRFPLQYMVEEGDKIVDGVAIQTHPEIYGEDYRNKFNLGVVNFIKQIMKGRKTYDSGNVKYVMDQLPAWLTCDNQTMTYSYAKESLLTGKPFNESLAMKLKNKNDFYIQYTGARLFLPGKDTFFDDTLTAGEINIWNAVNVHKVLLGMYVEETINKWEKETHDFTNLYFTNDFLETLGNMMQNLDETTPMEFAGDFKMLPKVSYPTDYDGSEVESFDMIPKRTPYSTIYQYEDNKVDIQDLTVEEVLELDKQYVESVYLPQCANSYYLHYESCVLLKDNLDDPNCDGTVAGTNNIFQMQWPTAKGTDTCVIMIARVGEKMDVQEVWHNFWIEDFDLMNEDIRLTYQEAYEAFMESNYPKPASRQCVLRKEVGPVEGVAPQYIFGNNLEHYYVDSVSGEVRDTNPVFEGYEDEETKYHKVTLELIHGTTEDDLEQIVAEGQFALWMITPDAGYKAPPTAVNGSVAKMVNGQDAVLSNDVVDSDFTVTCECIDENTLVADPDTDNVCPVCGAKRQYKVTGVLDINYEYWFHGIRTESHGHASEEYQFHYYTCPHNHEEAFEIVEYRETPSWWDDLWGNDCPFTRGDIREDWAKNQTSSTTESFKYEGYTIKKW